MFRFTHLVVAFLALFVCATPAKAVTVSDDLTISNNPIVGLWIGTFGPGMFQTSTYGQVFTPSVSGLLTSFSLSLKSGLTGGIVGGVGNWNGPAKYAGGYGPTEFLYMSAPINTADAQLSTLSGSPLETYTYHPNVSVTAGQQYVVFLTISGVDDVFGDTKMPVGTSLSGLDYFVWNNGALNSSGSWNYYFDLADVYGSSNALTSLTISQVPLPAALPLFGFALGGIGLAGFRRRKS